jgi:hypothetical protein
MFTTRQVVIRQPALSQELHLKACLKIGYARIVVQVKKTFNL